MAEQYIFTMLRLNKYFGQKQILKNINLSFYPGAKIGIVGENGSGKSTVLKIMAGIDKDFQGTAELSKGYTSGMVAQEPVLDGEMTVRETIELAFSEKMGFLKEYEDLSTKMAEPMSDDDMQKLMDRMGDLQDKLDASDAWNIDQHINQASEALVLPDDNRLIKTLSGGEKRRVALCKALLEHPDLLLLDEPTNHLDPETIDWLEARLKEYDGTVIIVTHDRYFLDNITKWILELEGGFGLPYEGNYSSWLQQKLEKIMSENKKNSPVYRSLEKELAWIKMNGKDRRELTRNRLADYEKIISNQSSDDDEVIQIAPGPDLGTQVIEYHDVSKSYGDNILIKELNFLVPRGAVIGVIGPNGAGKTTLINMTRGKEQPDNGNIVLGSTVKFAYVDQERMALEGDKSLIDEIGEGASEVQFGRRIIPIRQYVSRFGFKGADQQKTVKELSGGERNRCNLAKILKVGGNVLLLDEPTNDLDVTTLRLLEEAIQNFKGCVLIISHDRFFLDRICTNMIVFEGDGNVRWFEGNYREYEEWRIKELGGKLFDNRRNRYRRLPKK